MWLDASMTSPYKLYQYFVQTDDRDVERYLRLFTFLPLAEIECIVFEHEQAKEARKAQTVLAEHVRCLEIFAVVFAP